MENRYLTEDIEQRKGVILMLTIKLAMILITEGFPPCTETIIALKLAARINELMPDNMDELLSSERMLIDKAKQELEFLMKDMA